MISRECQILLLDLHKQGKERAERELEEAELEISSLKKENKTQSQLIEELHDQVGIPLPPRGMWVLNCVGYILSLYHEHSCNINFAPFSFSLIKLRHRLYAGNPTCPNSQIVQLKNNMNSQEENVAVCLKGQQEKLEKTLVELQECKTTAQEMRTRKVFLWFCHLFFKIVFFSNLSIPCLNDLRGGTSLLRLLPQSIKASTKSLY